MQHSTAVSYPAVRPMTFRNVRIVIGIADPECHGRDRMFKSQMSGSGSGLHVGIASVGSGISILKCQDRDRDFKSEMSGSGSGSQV